MITRVRKEVPLYEKYGLFTEAPRKKRKRIISVRSSRAKDYTLDVDPEEIETNNISPEEDPTLSGDMSGLGFDNPDMPNGGMEDELSTTVTKGSDVQIGGDSGSSPEGNLEGEVVPRDGTETSDQTPEEGDSTAVTDTPLGTDTDTTVGADGGTETGNTDGENLPTDAGDGTDGTDTVSAEPGEGDVSGTTGLDETDAGDGTGDDAGGATGGDQATEPGAEPTDIYGEPADAGASDTAGQDQPDIDGTGDVIPPKRSGRVIDIDNDDYEDYTVSLDTEDDELDMGEEDTGEMDPNMDSDVDMTADDGTMDDQTVDPNTDPNADSNAATNSDVDSAATDPNAVADPNADPSMDPNADPATDPNAMNADMEAFDKNDMRKYQLFKRFIDIHDVLNHWLKNLEAIISDDADYGAVIAKITKKLKRLEELLKDYMVIKFQSDSIFQNLYFFERTKAAMYHALEGLKQGKKRKVTSKQ